MSLSEMLFFFFFSSRRRHTRCGRDWSSDVCSSDLSYEVAAGLGAVEAAALVEASAGLDLYNDVIDRLGACPNRMIAPSAAREEETFLRWCRRDAPPSGGAAARLDAPRWPA